MRWRIATALALVALAAVAADGLAAPAPKLAGVRVTECAPADHAATFYARMKRLPGSSSMSIRLTLLQRTGGAGFAPLKLPSLSRWHTSQPGRSGFAVRQRVRNLVDGAAYRARVRYLWRDGKGRLVRSARRISRSCKIVARRLPNLKARPIWAHLTRVQGVLRYAVKVVNAGSAPARDVPVRLSVDGSEVNTKNLAGTLAPGESQTLFFRGPACERNVVATADPAGSIPEGSETDNSGTAACADLRR